MDERVGRTQALHERGQFKRDCPSELYPNKAYPRIEQFDIPDTYCPRIAFGPEIYGRDCSPRRFALTYTYGRLDQKLPKWYHFLELIRSGMNVTEALKESHSSYTLWWTWIHMDSLRYQEYAEAMGPRLGRSKYQPHEIRIAINLLDKCSFEEAAQQAKVHLKQLTRFLRYYPQYREQYELVTGRPYKFNVPMVPEHWDHFFELLPLYGPQQAAFASRAPVSIIRHRLAHDEDFQRRVRRIWDHDAVFTPMFPTTAQVQACIELLPTVGLIEQACFDLHISQQAMWEFRALNFDLEQQILEQLREYDRRLHPYYRRWAQSDEADQPFTSLYHQTQYRELAYQRCVAQAEYDEACTEAQFKVNRVRPTFVERFGLA